MNDEPISSYSPTKLDYARFKASRAKHQFIRFWRNSCERAKWIGHTPNNLEKHALHELGLAGWLSDDGLYGRMVGDAVMKMMREFADEGHSGMSAGIVNSIFNTLAKFEPLTPLTGADDEWNEVCGGTLQNRRCSHVFKDTSGAYDINGKVFREPSGCSYTSRDSRVPVVFPYTPKTEYVDVDAADGVE